MKTRPGESTGPGPAITGPRTSEPGAAQRQGGADGDWGRRSQLRDGLLYCLKVFLAVRIGLSILALLAVALLPDLTVLGPAFRSAHAIPGPVDVPGWPAHFATHGWTNLFTAWERFDGLWYLRIAAHGYRNGDGSAAFFPLYPLLVAAVSFVIGRHPFAASLIVSNVSFLGALMMLYVLGRNELSEPLARRAVAYAAVFPAAVFFLAPYSESLFLVLALVAFWAARQGRWPMAGAAGLLAALTRNVGLVIVLPLAVEAVQQALAVHPRRWPVRPLLWSLAPAAGTFSYLLYWRLFAGQWLAPLHQQAIWERHLQDPVLTLAKGTHEAFRYIGFYPGGYHLLDWLVALPVLVAAGYAAVSFRPAYGVYAWAGILVPLSFIFAGRPLMSFPRFALPLFPIYWAGARWTSTGRGRHEIVLATSAALLGVMTVLFAAWYYVF